MAKHLTQQKALVLSLFVSAVFASHTTAQPMEVSFDRDIRPILSDRCFKCHGPDAVNQRSDFRLDERDHAIADLGGYAGIVPGDLEESELHHRIRTEDADEMMPPPDSGLTLTVAQKDALDTWVLAGAPYEAHQAFKPLPRVVAVPEAGEGWARNPVDRFVFDRLEREGLSPNNELPRTKWLRRVTFDLTGLPPTLDEIDAFLSDDSDDSDDAYERVVDRLLDTDAYAERMATEWLDVARYSDSYGYQRDDERFVWPWRDWVIRAFRQNMPYSQFITEQLAGDLLPDATEDQKLATAFNRLHSHKKEGGVAVEEFRVENVADRTHTVAAAFMGLTMECARCHDHKYDPITTKDYYRFSSFFANIEERGLISYFTDAVPTPAMPLPSDSQRDELQSDEQAVREAEAAVADIERASGPAFEAWLGDRKVELMHPGLVAELTFDGFEAITDEHPRDEEGNKLDPATVRGLRNTAGTEQAITIVENTLVPGKHDRAIRLTGDDAVVLPGIGHYERHEPFSISLWMWATDIQQRSVIYRRSRGWDDAGSIGYELVLEDGNLTAKLAHFWPGNAIGVETIESLTPQQWHHVAVTYDGSSRAEGLRIYLNGAMAEANVIADHLTRNITQWTSGYRDLAIGSRYRDRGFKDGRVDDFMVFDRFLAPIEVAQLKGDKALELALSIPVDRLSKPQRKSLRTYFLSTIHQPMIRATAALGEARAHHNAVVDGIPAITVMREQATPRPAFVLTRGAYDQHGEAITAGTPGFLPPMPDDAPRNRLGLAQWLTSPDHPLTARVTVNRYWQMLFGHGIVRTPEDFGNQGQPATHGDLLDWLARDFVDHNWDVQRLLRTLVLSATYRQSAVVDRSKRNADPENRWLSRGPSQRLTAEMIRDNALAVSGLLVRQVGGPPVKPYDLALAYTPLTPDEGGGLYRRSIYTFWKRTSPAPIMITMNAARREVCRLNRDTTDSPLQSLVLLNSPQFVEASRLLAASLIEQLGNDTNRIINQAFRLFTSRVPTDAERSVLSDLFNEQQETFAASPKQAEALLSVGRAPHGSPQQPSRLAAATVLINMIMNLDESVRQQ